MAKQWESIAAKDGYRYNIGTLFHHASAADPNWRKKIPTAEPTTDDSPPTADNSPPTAEKPKQGQKTLIKSSGEFVADFVPPDYLIDGLLQRRFLYALTGVTGLGKTAVALAIALHVALGLRLGKLEVERGKVLYFAGKIPTMSGCDGLSFAKR